MPCRARRCGRGLRAPAARGLTLRQLQQDCIAGSRVGEVVLAQAEPPPQLLADSGRQPLEHIGHKLRGLAAQALLQVGRAFER
jgi:hypothetical protein